MCFNKGAEALWSAFLFVKSGESISTRTKSASRVILAGEKRKTHTERERQREGEGRLMYTWSS